MIANLYTLHFGKITGIFKAFHTCKKEFSSSLDICTLNEFVFYPKKRDIWLISFADLVSDFPFLRESISKNKVASAFANLIDKTMPLWEANPHVFGLLKNSLEWLSKEEEDRVIYTFLVKFLSFSGFKPEFTTCLFCRRPLDEEFFLSISRGGLVCKKCTDTAGDYQKISKETSSSLSYIQNNDFPMALRLNPTLECIKEIHYLLRQFILYHLEYDISPQLSLKV